MQNKHLNLHKNAEEFLAAINYTVSALGFRSELIEKDYYCSLALAQLFAIKDCPLIFKGGTMLSKVYGNFFRLSEDIDLTLPIDKTANRNQRRNAIKPIKELYNRYNENNSTLRRCATIRQ